MGVRLGVCAVVSGMALLPHLALAQSITISPSYASVGVNGTVQYKATVTGQSNTAVTWEVSDVKGGNATNGTITAAGLYTAPAKIPPNDVTITALGSDNKTSATVYVNVAPPGPAISAISPNPAAVGQYTVTVSGSGFVNGTEVRAGDVVLSTTYVNSTTLRSNGYQGSAGNVAFEASNPGSLWGPAYTERFSGSSSSSSSSSSGGGSSSSTGGHSSSSSSSSSSGGHSSSSSSSSSSGSSGSGSSSGSSPTSVSNPVLFVTQVPTAAFTGVQSVFDSQQTDLHRVPRGGDLWIAYPDGKLRNLTAEAGYGLPSGAQDGAKAIAVRQPTVHWSGQKAIFSMLVGGAPQQYYEPTANWQLYEVSGIQEGGKAVITAVPCQPTQFNNIAPFYGSDGQVIFTSDQPRSGLSFLYPQRDEYESTPTDTGLWKLDPSDCGSVRIIDHAVSGVTYPSVDSFGRIVFTKWDHLLRDQQADHDQFESPTYGAFNYKSETDNSIPSTFSRAEVFPELRLKTYSMGSAYDGKTVAADYPYNDFGFNHFFPWMVNQDGSAEETLDHVGRHELGGTYTLGNFAADSDLHDLQPGKYNGATYFLGGSAGMFHLREDPTTPGLYYGVSSPEFATASAGDLVRLAGAPGTNPDSMKVQLLASTAAAGGHYRNPLPMKDGHMLAVFAPTTADLAQGGTTAAPTYNYSFRLRLLNGAYLPGTYLTGAGISKSVQYWDPDTRVSWSGLLWELDPVEVVARTAPAKTVQPALPAQEAAVVGNNQQLLQLWLEQRKLALIVSRNVTERDRADLQQPFDLRVSGSATQTLGAASSTVYNVSHLQLYQADQIRGYTGSGKPPQSGGTPTPGRRNLAQPMHDPAAVAAMGSLLDAQAQTPIAPDGSVAAFVPAGRAMTWELVDASKTGWNRGIVRERNWVDFKPGELRVCTNCHGINTYDQAGQTAPSNTPQALGTLMQQWAKVVRNNCPASGGTGSWSFNGVPWQNDHEGQQYRIQTCQNGACCDGLPATQTQAAAP